MLKPHLIFITFILHRDNVVRLSRGWAQDLYMIFLNGQYSESKFETSFMTNRVKLRLRFT